MRMCKISVRNDIIIKDILKKKTMSTEFLTAHLYIVVLISIYISFIVNCHF